MIFNPLLLLGVLVAASSIFFGTRVRLQISLIIAGAILVVVGWLHPPHSWFIYEPYKWAILLTAALYVLQKAHPKIRRHLKSLNWMVVVAFASIFLFILLDRFPVLGELSVGKEGFKIAAPKSPGDARLIPTQRKEFRFLGWCGPDLIRDFLSGPVATPRVLEAKVFYLETVLRYRPMDVQEKQRRSDERGAALRAIKDYTVYTAQAAELAKKIPQHVTEGERKRRLDIAEDLSRVLLSPAVRETAARVPAYYIANALVECLAARTDEVLNWLYEGHQRFPDNPGLHQALARASYSIAEDDRAAIRYTEEALSLLTTTRNDLERYYSEALELLREAAAKEPGVRAKLQEVERHKKDVGDKIIGGIREMRPYLMNEIAYLSALEGVSENQAREYARQALLHNKNQAAWLDTAGYVALRFARTTNEVQDAVRYFEQALHEAQRSGDREAERFVREHLRDAFRTLMQRPPTGKDEREKDEPE